MIENIVRFCLILLLSLVVGTMFGIWIGFNPAPLSASAYIEQQQNTIRALNVLMPVLGAICIILAASFAAVARSDRVKRYLIVAAALLLVLAGLITRFGNQPINAVVMTWSASAPPTDWAALRDRWWHWHVIRTSAAIGALVLILLAAFRSRTSPNTDAV
jgi:hypothetical protein